MNIQLPDIKCWIFPEYWENPLVIFHTYQGHYIKFNWSLHIYLQTLPILPVSQHNPLNVPNFSVLKNHTQNWQTISITTSENTPPTNFASALILQLALHLHNMAKLNLEWRSWTTTQLQIRTQQKSFFGKHVYAKPHKKFLQ